MNTTTDSVRARIPATLTAAFVKPRLRGWIHVLVAPLATAAGIVLTALAPTGDQAWACAIFMVCSLLLFGISALYHRFNWGPRMMGLLRRLDHANIFLLIAGTYTPITVGVLHPADAAILLSIVWAGALAGIGLALFWPRAPRWLYVPIYILLGWVAVFFMPQLVHHGGWALVILLLAGGASYTLGAIVYGFKRPDPFPRWFGFHEIFHLGTVAGWVCCCIAAYFAILS